MNRKFHAAEVTRYMMEENQRTDTGLTASEGGMSATATAEKPTESLEAAARAMDAAEEADMPHNRTENPTPEKAPFGVRFVASWVAFGNAVAKFFIKLLPVFFTKTLPAFFRAVPGALATFFTKILPNFFKSIPGAFKTFFGKVKNFRFRKLTKAERANLIDRLTTFLLMLLFSVPFLILLYIILWFMLK